MEDDAIAVASEGLKPLVKRLPGGEGHDATLGLGGLVGGAVGAGHWSWGLRGIRLPRLNYYEASCPRFWVGCAIP